MLVFYFFVLVVIGLGVLSLRGGLRFAAYMRREASRPLSDFHSFASVFVPCRGLEDGLRENLTALCRQNYPAYEIVFVVDQEDDPALRIIEEVAQGETTVRTRVVVAGKAVDCGQKVHNLRVAVTKPDPESVVFVFVDSDARPEANWLQSLVAPLSDPELGAATGYRWFVPERGGLASQLRSVWNASIASALGADKTKNFCWGGSTAIRRSTFEKLQVAERWRGTVSDDFALTNVLHEANLPIHFVPACLVASVGDCSFRELLEFTNRQLKITRVYAANLWQPLLIGSFLFCAVFFGGMALLVARYLRHLDFTVLLIALPLIYLLGAAKAWIRLRAVGLTLANYRKRLSMTAHLMLWPLASALYLYNALTAAFSQRINWRGTTYELKSATEAVIISRE
ncbi:MAG TPA: glycosyltransferase family 2 protein [Pyrinomonadaceae bacterium]|nr:glycosyltransferase family 2 protein [Pyrinomonadaceae bacterium]